MCGLIQGWPRRTAQQRGVDVRDRVRAFVAAPSEEQEHLGKASSTQREAGRKTVDPGIGAEVPTLQANLPSSAMTENPSGPQMECSKLWRKNMTLGARKRKS